MKLIRGEAVVVKILVIGESLQCISENIRDVINRLQKKREFKGVQVEYVQSASSINNDTALVFCDEQTLYGLLCRDLRGRMIPVVVVMDKFTSSEIHRIFTRGYPRIVGLLLKDTQDPEEWGNVTRIIKEEVRRFLTRQGQWIFKEVGWKIQLDLTGSQQSRPLVSLFIDPPMREFMQRLINILATVPFPAAGKPPNFRELFQKIYAHRRGIDRNNPESQVKELLYDGPKSGFSAPLLWFQPILLEGETGVGKTVVAHFCRDFMASLHSNQNIPFQHVSLANLEPHLMESELFGVIPGTFTDALPTVGKLLLARGGIAFLDEIGELPLSAQAKLLKFLDTMEFTPMGWDYEWSIFSPVYVIAATNRDLRRAIREGTFREDLYYRFRHRLRVPPLRERRGELRAHNDLLLQDPNINPGRRINKISLDALVRLEQYDYPGNFRELETILYRAISKATWDNRDIILPSDIELPG